jgi:Na+-transporting methylmalonyl-CoA/oxaloacetate decarboxylase gamma subunit
MSIVFMVLALTFGSIVFLGWLERRFPVAPAAAVAASSGAAFPAVEAASVTPEEEAAIHAAIAHHTGLAPETFQTRITPVKKES